MVVSSALAAVVSHGPQLVYCIPAQLPGHLTATRLSAVCAPVAVGIGIVVAYLTLDRFRYHARIIGEVKRVEKLLEPVETLIKNVEDGKDATQIERNVLALHYLCATSEADEQLKQHKEKILNGGLDSVLRFTLGLLTRMKIDRWISFGTVTVLCVAEFWVSEILLTQDDPPGWMDRPLYGTLLFATVALAYVVPLIAFLVGEGALLIVRSSVKRWIKEESIRQQRAAKEAKLPTNGSVGGPVAFTLSVGGIGGAGAVGGETDFKA